MAVSLEQAAAEFKQNIDKFVDAYRAQHAKEREKYPLEMADDNSGLWVEFMTSTLMALSEENEIEASAI
jgi:hypothetical protein